MSVQVLLAYSQGESARLRVEVWDDDPTGRLPATPRFDLVHRLVAADEKA